jgi:hypothetical protein
MAEDEGEGAFYGFVEAWAEKYGTLPVAAKDLLGLADDAGIIPDNAHDRLKSLGRMLSYRKSRIFAGYKIVVKRNQHTKNLTFYLLDIKPGEEPAGEPAASILDSYLPAETPELAFF